MPLSEHSHHSRPHSGNPHLSTLLLVPVVLQVLLQPNTLLPQMDSLTGGQGNAGLDDFAHMGLIDDLLGAD